MGQEWLGPSYFFISLVLGPLNSLLEESTDPNRYTAKAKFCFCKNNKRMIIISVGARKLPAGGTLLNVDRSIDVSNWKTVGSAEKQMHFPRCLKNPFEERILLRSSFGGEDHAPQKRV